MELKSIADWQELLIQKHKMHENDVMELARTYAKTAADKEPIRIVLEASRDERHRIESSLAARLAKSDSRPARMDRNDGRDGGAMGGRLPR